MAIVATHPIQHFCPLYKALSSDSRVTLRVLFASTAGLRPFYDSGFGQKVRFQDDITDGFDHEFLPGHLDGTLTRNVSNPHIQERLAAFDPDVVQVYGYHHRLSRDSIKWARANGRLVLYCSDSELLTPRRLYVRVVKRFVLPRIFANCDGFITVGDCNEDYYRHYGADSDLFFRVPFPIDDSKLLSDVQSRAAARHAINSKFGLPADSILALIVGKLTARKAVHDAINAVGLTWRSGLEGKLFLIVAGSGPQRESLEALARSACPSAIRFAGFVEVSQLPTYYCAADVLIHPSSEDPHPLATSEAVFCGLPVILSDRVGSAGPTDDVRIGVNGLRFRFGQRSELAKILGNFCRDPDKARRMSDASRKIGEARTLRICAERYIGAVTTLLARKSVKQRGLSQTKAPALWV